jgi:CelD/BcsL family acetyltransferase involved in cellulose biosynthesis
MDVPPGSPLLAARPPAGWSAAWSEGNACPVLALAEIPAGIRRKLRMNRNRAERAGGWTVEAAGPAGFEVLAALHRARWQADGEPGVLADPAVLRCLHQALPALEAAGLLRLQVLRVGGEAAAAIMALLAPGRIFFYLSGYDAAQRFVSPGTLLVGAMLEQAAAEGRTEAHFLRGREGYKYAWGALDRLNSSGGFRVA